MINNIKFLNLALRVNKTIARVTGRKKNKKNGALNTMAYFKIGINCFATESENTIAPSLFKWSGFKK